MRPILITLGPWQWYAYPVIVVVLAVGVVVWRRLARVLGEEVPPMTGPRLAGTTIAVLAGAAVVYVIVNRIAPVEIKSWGTMLVLGFGAAIWWMAQTVPREELSVADIVDLALFVLVGSIVGARVVFVALNWSSFYAAAPASVLSVWEGGLSFHGGVGGALLSGGLYCRLRRKNLWRLADLVAPAIPLGYAITRVGCFLNGCCYGVRTALPWGVVFPDANIGGVPTPRHPTQLYASVTNLVIFVILARMARRPHPTGYMFGMYLLLYSVYRFFIEFLRKGATAVVFEPLAPLTEAQVASLVIGVGAAVGLAIIGHRAKSR